MSGRASAVTIALGVFAATVLGTLIVALSGGTPEDVTTTFVLGGFFLGIIGLFLAMVVSA